MSSLRYLGKRTALLQSVEANFFFFFTIKTAHEDSPENPLVVYNNMKIKRLSVT